MRQYNAKEQPTAECILLFFGSYVTWCAQDGPLVEILIRLHGGNHMVRTGYD
jgi:hypothetical protein